MRLLFQSLLAIIVFSLAFYSCQPAVDCIGEGRDFIVVNFKSKSTGEDSLVVYDTIKAMSSDSIFYDFNDTLSTFNLPLNINATQATYLFRKAGFDTTIVVSYQVQTSIIDDLCPPDVIFFNLDTLSTSFDSLVVTDKTLFQNSNANFEIYK